MKLPTVCRYKFYQPIRDPSRGVAYIEMPKLLAVGSDNCDGLVRDLIGVPNVERHQVDAVASHQLDRLVGYRDGVVGDRFG